MTRRTSKHGTVYSEGSHQSLTGFPRVCFGCGDKAVLKRQHLWQETLLPSYEKRTWHFRCHPTQRAAA